MTMRGDHDDQPEGRPVQHLIRSGIETDLGVGRGKGRDGGGGWAVGKMDGGIPCAWVQHERVLYSSTHPSWKNRVDRGAAQFLIQVSVRMVIIPSPSPHRPFFFSNMDQGSQRDNMRDTGHRTGL